MKFADRLKFTATGTSAATITVVGGVTGCRTLAQAIADGASDPLAIKVGDTGVPFIIDDGAGNWEDSLFTITSATQIDRTSVISSSAGGTTPATFTGTPLTVFNSMPASFARRLPIGAVDSSGNTVGLVGSNGKDFLVVSSAAPSNSDGRPDGTVYIQTA